MAEPASDELIAEIEELLESWDALPSSMVAALIARIREQDATIKRMDEALKPFADELTGWEEASTRFENDFSQIPNHSRRHVPLGWLRAARAARKEPT